MAKKDLLINNVFLKNRISELGLKQWWLAEQVGVDRKTVIRWIQGQVKSIQFENAERLAKVLDCSIQELSVSEVAELLATPEDQKAAATALTGSSLIDKLGPIEEWNVIESLLKATIVPDLPLNVLGELYDQLTIASWRQNKISQASLFNSKTEDIALKTNDKCLLASALLSKANIFSWKGETNSSIQTYRECIQFEKYLDSRVKGSAHSNLGAVLYESGDLDGGLAEIKKAIGIFNEDGDSINLSVAHTHLAIISLQRNQIDQAHQEVQSSIQFAKTADYRRGLNFGKLLLGEIEAYRQSKEESISLTEDALNQFAKMGITKGLNFEIAGRTFRLLGEFLKSQSLIENGISISADFPIYQAGLYVELAEVMKAQGFATWEEQAMKAMALYQKFQCPLRVEMVKKHFKFK